MAHPETTAAALRPFADPATEVSEDAVGGRQRVRLTRNGLAHEYIFHSADGIIEARLPETRRYASVASLLASQAFANIDRFADTQRRLLNVEGFDASSAIRPSIQLNGQAADVDDVDNALDLGPKTRIVLLDGPAGIGKTFLISWLVKRRAEAYLARTGSRPILHVRSRGRRLASLQEVFALSSQVVRAGFTFDQIPVLVRHGVLDVAIDGFDELTDADGYQNAWFALRDFFHDLDGAGACILAGRETFFDEQRFRHRLEGIQATIDLTIAHLSPSAPDEARRWLRSRGWTDEDLQEPELADMLKPDSYVLRPFFLGELAKTGKDRILDETPRATIISGILRREADLLANSLEVPVDKSRLGLSQLYREVAMDMAERESDTVDVEYLGFICEIAFGGILNHEDLLKVKHRIGSIALFEPDEIEHLRRFPHSEVQNFYLAEALIAQVSVGALPSVMRRNVVGSDLLEVFIEVFEREKTTVAEAFVRHLNRCVDQQISGDRLPLNATSLLLATYTRPVKSHANRLAHLTANEVVFRDVMEQVCLDHLIIDRLDARGADLSGILFDGTQVVILLADQSTRFSESSPQVHLLQSFVGGQWDITTDRHKIATRLASSKATSGRIRLPPFVEQRTPLLDLFDRICRRSLRRFHFRPDEEDDPANALFQDALWPEVEAVLSASNRLVRKTPPMSGARGELIHIKNPEALLWPGDDASSAEIRQQIVKRGIELQSG